MRRAYSLLVALGVAAALVCTGLPAVAAARPSGTLGRQLVKRFFTDTQKHNLGDLRRLLSPAFQVQRANGMRQTKGQFLARLPVVHSFQLRGLRVTSAPGTIVVTYQANVDEIIGGKPFRTGYLPRISVFVKGAQGWQLVAHSNFNKPK